MKYNDIPPACLLRSYASGKESLSVVSEIINISSTSVCIAFT